MKLSGLFTDWMGIMPNTTNVTSNVTSQGIIEKDTT